MKRIATQLHKAIETVDEGELDAWAKLPHYVVDPTLIGLLQRSDVNASIAAMVEAGIARLPLPELLVEFEADANRIFVVLKEQAGVFGAEVAVLSANAFEIDRGPLILTLQDAMIRVDGKRTHPSWQRAAGFALGVSLLMLNIQGVEREVVEPSKLNKQRLKRGAPAVPSHTIVRIGHVYDNNGERVGYEDGRQMPVHMRAGHARRQHFGPRNEQVKFIYIEPVIVNFRPGATPAPPKRVLAA